MAETVYMSRMLEVTPVLSRAAMSQVWKGLAVLTKVPFDASSNLLSWSLVVRACISLFSGLVIADAPPTQRR